MKEEISRAVDIRNKQVRAMQQIKGTVSGDFQSLLFSSIKPPRPMEGILKV
jgi:hypothetical protein